MIRALSILAIVFCLSACATPAIQPPMIPPAGFVGPAMEARTLLMDDGARLPLTRWSPASGEPWAVILALHGMNDSRASFRFAGPWWAEHGIETWAVDQRGFGQAPGRGVWAGEARMTEDLRTAVLLARARWPHAVIAVVGESMGGSVATAAAGSDRPPAADRTVLLSPGVWGWTAQGVVNSTALRLTARAMGDRAVEAPEWAIRDHPASDNRLELIRNGRDPDSLLSTRFDALYGLVDLMQSATDRLGRVQGPTLLMYGGHDNVIEKAPMRRALEQAGSPANLRTAFYPDGWHILDRDLQAETIYRDVETFLRDPVAPLPSGAGPVLQALRGADR